MLTQKISKIFKVGKDKKALLHAKKERSNKYKNRL